MMRGVKHCNLEGLRKRIATLFFHYIKTPLFNPEAMRHLKVLLFFFVYFFSQNSNMCYSKWKYIQILLEHFTWGPCEGPQLVKFLSND